MKNRIVTLVLAALMVFTVFAASGCSDTDDKNVTADVKGTTIKAMTLTLYTIKDKDTSQEAIEALQDAINKVTESRLNTHIVLRAYTEDEYYKVIDEKIDAIDAKQKYDEVAAEAMKKANKAAKSIGFTTAPPAAALTETAPAAETDETVYNDLGLKETVYPEATDDQLDIFLITNGEKYYDYYRRNVLLPLSETLSSENKILKDIVYPTFLSAAQIDGTLYAVPNNHMVGEYEYLVLNKKLFDKIYLDPATIVGISDLEEFVDYCVGQGVTPIVDTYGVDTFMYYPFGEDSVLGGYTEVATGRGSATEIDSKYGMRAYRSAHGLLDIWKRKGYISTDGGKLDSVSFGAAFVKGDVLYGDELRSNDNYYVIEYKKPTFSSEDVFSSMYAVGSYTKNLSRSMQVIALFATNEDFINAFVYGAEGIHYEVDKYTGLVRKLNDDYKMNPLYAGNQFKIRQSEDMTEAEKKFSDNKWELAKRQNGESQSDPFLGFVFDKNPVIDYEYLSDLGIDYSGFADIGESFEGVERLSEEIKEDVKNFVPGQTYYYSYEEEGVQYTVGMSCDTYEIYMEYLQEKIRTNPDFQQLLNPVNPYSLAGQFNTWLNG